MFFSVLTCCVLAGRCASAQQLQGRIETEKGETRNALIAHPLSWWTQDPLRFDTSGDLMIGFKAPDGQPITAKDYKIDEQTKTIGILAGHRIVQLLTSFHPGPRVIAAGFAPNDGSAAEWKDLLVALSNDDKFVDIYALHFDGQGLIQETSPEIDGTGPNAILVSYTPDTGNGGGCFDGYWWFDQGGPHEVDFSPLMEAVSHTIPANATFTPSCWALHPQTNELQSGVQRMDAECHACGMLGEVHARYRIERGVAKPVSVSFEPTPP